MQFYMSWDCITLEFHNFLHMEKINTEAYILLMQKKLGNDKVS